MKIYIPFCGIGLGHASRSLELGRVLKERGHDVLWSTYEPTYSKIKDFPVSKTGAETCIYQGRKGIEAFKTISRTSFELVKTPLFVKQHIDLIKKFGPDMVISDTYFAGILAGRISKLPVFFLTNQTNVSSFFPQKQYFALRASIDMLIKNFIEASDRILVPDIPLPNAICRYNIDFFGHREKFYFTGPIVKQRPSDVKAKKFDRTTLLVSIGGSGLNPDIRKYLKGMPEVDFIVVNSSLDKKEGNITYKKYVKDYFSYLKGADALVTHGGHSSLMEALVFGKPVLGFCLKGFAERANNLRGLKKGGNGTFIRNLKKDLERMDSYAKEARRLQKIALKHDGARSVANIIEENE